MTEHVFFGNKPVEKFTKTSLVKDVFSSVAGHYDRMNDFMSLGLHRLWKRHFVHMLAPIPQGKVLDIAGGTGDIALRIARTYPEMAVTVCDLTFDMLSSGKEKAINANLFTSLQWICGNAEQLPLPSCSYHYYTIAFGLRNVADRKAALTEAFRVLHYGGRFLCMEFSHVDNHYLSKLYDLYSYRMIPTLGRWVTGKEDAYQYLVDSIRTFPPQASLEEEIRTAGFSQVTHTNLLHGVVAIHSGWKI